MYYSITFPENMRVIYFNDTLFSPRGHNSVSVFLLTLEETNKNMYSGVVPLAIPFKFTMF